MSEDTINILRGLTRMLDPTEDFDNITTAEEHMRSVAANRAQTLEEQYAELKVLSRNLDSAKSSSTRPPTVPSEDAHARTLTDLDALRISLAKSINDAESQLASREAELSALKKQRLELESRDPANEHQLKSTPIILATFKGLGFEPITDKNGRIRKMLVRAESGDIHCVSFNDGKSEAEYTDILWKLASS